jgi:hypothetical protein
MADLGERITETLAGQHALIKKALLLDTAAHAQHFQRVEMVLRNLAERAIRRGDDRRDFGKRTVAHASAAVFARHRDTPQAARDEGVELGPRQPSLSVA